MKTENTGAAGSARGSFPNGERVIKKRIRIWYWILLILGSLAVGVALAAWDGPAGTKTALAIGWLALAVIAAIAIDLLWYRRLGQKLNALSRVLTEERDPDRYIAEVDRLLGDCRSPQLRQVRLIDLGTAYCEKEDYPKAKELYLQVRPEKLPPHIRAVYWADLALVSLHLGEEGEMCRILETEETLLAPFREQEPLGGLLAVLSIARLLAEGEAEDAAALLAEAQPRWETPRNAAEFAALADRCERELSRKQPAEDADA